MIDEIKLFYQPIKNDMKRYGNIQNFTIGQGDDYAIVFLLDCIYFKKYDSVTATGLSKQQALDAVPEVIQQINFTRNLGGTNKRVMFFIVEEAKKTFLYFSQTTVRVLQIFLL